MKSGSTGEAVFILVILVVIIFIAPRFSNDEEPVTATSSRSDSYDLFESEGTSDEDEAWSSRRETVEDPPRISLSRGSASRSYQPFEEYITIKNTGRTPVDITGWRLENARNERGTELGGNLRFFPADRAFIPQAARLLSPRGTQVLSNVVLERGEEAIVTTGSMGSRLPYVITSFKENACTGYLEDLDVYAFNPPLSRDCPRPRNEAGTAFLDRECREFVERLASCQMPDFKTRDPEGENCRNCVNGKRLSNSCVAFIETHFNYESCLRNHAGDADFSGNRWRIFLGRSWEMWAEDYETIRLFDRTGELMAEERY